MTPYTEDDGFAIGALAWSPGTKSIAFTRGQSLEDETPTNVNNSPQGPMPKDVWVVATAIPSCPQITGEKMLDINLEAGPAMSGEFL